MFAKAITAMALAAGLTASAGNDATLRVTGKWMQVPVMNGARECLVNAHVGRTNPFSFHISASTNGPDWFFPVDVSRFTGGEIRFKGYPSPNSPPIPYDRIRFTDTPEYGKDLYREEDRLQFHFSPIVGWMNDPNGLSYYKGEWHLFYQAVPFSRSHWMNSWGHAVSKDLVHWKEHAPAVWPDSDGFIASGSGVVDETGSAGLGKGVQVLFYSRFWCWGTKDPTFTQEMAWSNDGRTYRKYEGNPVLKEIVKYNRDPKVFWHAPSKKWVMVLYVPKCDGEWNSFRIFNSDDLRNWELASVLRGARELEAKPWTPECGTHLYECPELVELPIEGEGGTRWVVWGATGRYSVGRFDGRTFETEEKDIPQLFSCFGGYYAGQVFNNAPNGRKVRIVWYLNDTPPRAHFDQAMGLPQDLSLVRTKDGLRLAAKPVRELETLRKGPAVSPEKFCGELAELHVTADVASGSGRVEMDLRGIKIAYDAKKRIMRCSAPGQLKVPRPSLVAPKALDRDIEWPCPDGRLDVRVFLDRTGFEMFSGDGLLVLPVPNALPSADSHRLAAVSEGGVRILRAEAYELRSAW